jgi:hypothetical protein
VYECNPRFTPCTVKDVEPVLARFPRRITLTSAASVDQPSVALNPRSPIVITTRRVPRAPDPCMHLTDVSDSHSVASQPVSPPRMLPVCMTRPMLDPCTVTDVAPVPALLPRRTKLKKPTSMLKLAETLPVRSDSVMPILRLPLTPWPRAHRIDVSDSHSVASHPVCPVRASPVYATSPRLAPCTVTDADPDPARFTDRVRLTTEIPIEKPDVTLDDRSPAVITTRRVPRVP